MSTKQDPGLRSERLTLSPISLRDVDDIQHFAAAWEIADAMISIPHPYPADEAKRYVERHREEMARDIAYTFVLRELATDNFAGIIELRAIDREHSLGELSFWLAKPAWGRGYMREALPVVVAFGFDTLRLNRLYAFHMQRNPASGRILEKTGFRQV